MTGPQIVTGPMRGDQKAGGNTTLGLLWVLFAPADRAIVIAYEDRADEVYGLMRELTERKRPDLELSYGAGLAAFLQRRILTVRAARRLNTWRPALWLDDPLAMLHSHLRIGPAEFGGASVDTGILFMLPGYPAQDYRHDEEEGT